MSPQERTAVQKVVRGLLKIARLAMPDTYFETDSRVRRAQRLMIKLKRKEGRVINKQFLEAGRLKSSH